MLSSNVKLTHSFQAGFMVLCGLTSVCLNSLAFYITKWLSQLKQALCNGGKIFPLYKQIKLLIVIDESYRKWIEIFFFLNKAIYMYCSPPPPPQFISVSSCKHHVYVNKQNNSPDPPLLLINNL